MSPTKDTPPAVHSPAIAEIGRGLPDELDLTANCVEEGMQILAHDRVGLQEDSGGGARTTRRRSGEDR
jgi:hypothetical protein